MEAIKLGLIDSFNAYIITTPQTAFGGEHLETWNKKQQNENTWRRHKSKYYYYSLKPLYFKVRIIENYSCSRPLSALNIKIDVRNALHCIWYLET